MKHHPLFHFLLTALSTNALLYPHSPYISHSFSFPHIPYHVALPHIHTPERCVEPYALVPPQFQITRTMAPVRYQGYVAIGFWFSTLLGGEQCATMFSSDPECSQILFMDARRRPYLLVSYSVRPFVSYAQACRNELHKGHEGGSAVRVTGSYLASVNGSESQSPSLLWNLCVPRIVEKLHAQHAMQFRRGMQEEDFNLKEYRRMVLKI